MHDGDLRTTLSVVLVLLTLGGFRKGHNSLSARRIEQVAVLQSIFYKFINLQVLPRRLRVPRRGRAGMPVALDFATYFFGGVR